MQFLGATFHYVGRKIASIWFADVPIYLSYFPFAGCAHWEQGGWREPKNETRRINFYIRARKFYCEEFYHEPGSPFWPKCRRRDQIKRAPRKHVPTRAPLSQYYECSCKLLTRPLLLCISAARPPTERQPGPRFTAFLKPWVTTSCTTAANRVKGKTTLGSYSFLYFISHYTFWTFSLFVFTSCREGNNKYFIFLIILNLFKVK